MAPKKQTQQPEAPPANLAVSALGNVLSTLSHDMRNQLNGILLELTDLKERLAEKGLEAETDILTSQIMTMSQDLKRLRERSEVPELRLSDMPVRSWLESLPDTFCRLDGAEGRIQWEIRIRDSNTVDFASFDATLMAAAIEELLRNALESDHCEPTKAERARRHDLGFGEPSQENEPVHVTAGYDREKHGLRIIVENKLATPPLYLQQWGVVPLTTKHQRVGLGCARAQAIARSHQGRCRWSFSEDPALLRASLEVEIAPA